MSDEKVEKVIDERKYTKTQIKANRFIFGVAAGLVGIIIGCYLSRDTDNHVVHESDLNGDGTTDIVYNIGDALGMRSEGYLRRETTGELVSLDEYKSNLIDATYSFESNEIGDIKIHYNAARDTIDAVCDEIEDAAKNLK